jgi:hypothetical protein
MGIKITASVVIYIDWIYKCYSVHNTVITTLYRFTDSDYLLVSSNTFIFHTFPNVQYFIRAIFHISYFIFHISYFIFHISYFIRAIFHTCNISYISQRAIFHTFHNVQCAVYFMSVRLRCEQVV